MKRNMELIRDCLMDIEENAKSLQYYNISFAMTQKGYDIDECFSTLSYMEESGLFGKTNKDLSCNFEVQGLSKLGYDFIEKIREEDIWNKTKQEINKKKLPRTIKFIAEVAGAFWGEFSKHKNS
ncbi:MAG: DUF2513 domain-containing protein [Clostridiales bacterium]|nr:DUF2513 domain-containing protein [Clostridiales bacterium]